MTKIAWIGLLAMTLAACSGRTKTLRTETPAATPAAPRTYTYRVIESYPHSTDSYTQGLLFADGVMWEGTGEYGHSRLQRIDLETGRTDVVATLPRSEFGEGIALLDGKIYQLNGIAYDAASEKFFARGELLAPVVGFVQAVLLYHRAESAVEQQDAVFEFVSYVAVFCHVVWYFIGV